MEVVDNAALKTTRSVVVGIVLRPCRFQFTYSKNVGMKATFIDLCLREKVTFVDLCYHFFRRSLFFQIDVINFSNRSKADLARIVEGACGQYLLQKSKNTIVN